MISKILNSVFVFFFYIGTIAYESRGDMTHFVGAEHRVCAPACWQRSTRHEFVIYPYLQGLSYIPLQISLCSEIMWDWPHIKVPDCTCPRTLNTTFVFVHHKYFKLQSIPQHLSCLFSSWTHCVPCTLHTDTYWLKLFIQAVCTCIQCWGQESAPLFSHF